MKKILIADDEALVVQLLCDLFIKNGYEPLTSSSGPEAVQKAKQDPPDALIADIFMPGDYNGIEAARIIQDKFGIPVYLISGYPREDVRDVLEEFKFTKFFEKPLNLKEIIYTFENSIY